MSEFSIEGNGIAFEITVDDEVGLVRMDGGRWYLTFPDDYSKGGGPSLLCSGRTMMDEVIKRAYLQTHLRAVNRMLRERNKT